MLGGIGYILCPKEVLNEKIEGHTSPSVVEKLSYIVDIEILYDAENVACGID